MISSFSGPTPTERFQRNVLADYSDGDPDFEVDLITSYKDSVNEHLPQLSESLSCNDEKASILHSHDIKGSSSYMGAEAVRFLSGKIEAYCKEGRLSEAANFLDELKTEVDELFKLLDKHMASFKEGGGDNKQETSPPPLTATPVPPSAVSSLSSSSSLTSIAKGTDDHSSKSTTVEASKPSATSDSNSSKPSSYTTHATDKPNSQTATEKVLANHNNNTPNNNSSNSKTDKQLPAGNGSNLEEPPRRATTKN